ncbi:MAG: hypothetical protein Q7K39_01960 [Candidatus Magasanikbacteria bacterium]|nr:hypothetical protein [Candidatus Magasanikbacteria bacterium]
MGQITHHAEPAAIGTPGREKDPQRLEDRMIAHLDTRRAHVDREKARERNAAAHRPASRPSLEAKPAARFEVTVTQKKKGETRRPGSATFGDLLRLKAQEDPDANVTLHRIERGRKGE